jgi:hypothetical protein
MADETIKTRKSSESRATPSDISNGHNNVEEDAGGTGPKKEIGGRDGPDPTRFGDWEKAGRCIDF